MSGTDDMMNSPSLQFSTKAREGKGLQTSNVPTLKLATAFTNFISVAAMMVNLVKGASTTQDEPVSPPIS